MATLCTGIYKIENVETGKRYIGSATYIYERLSRHRGMLRNNTHFNKKLQNAFNKYGEEKFVFGTVIRCAKEDLIFYEQLIIDGYNAVDGGYNILPVAGRNSGMEGRRHSAETKAKMSAAAKGRKKSPEHCAAMGRARKGLKRGPHSEEHKNKLSESIKRALAAKGRAEYFDDPQYKSKQSSIMKQVWKKRKGG